MIHTESAPHPLFPHRGPSVRPVPTDAPPALGRTLRHCAESLLQMSGMASWCLRWRRVQGAVILMYHSVAGPETAEYIDPRNRIPASVFETQMHFLIRHRRVIGLSALIETLLEGRTPPAGSVVLTFDDGYRDNLEVAAPILDRLRLPWTLFLPTAYLERGESPPVDQLYAMFRFRTRERLEWGGRIFDLRSMEDTRRVYRICDALLLAAHPMSRPALLEELSGRLRPWRQAPRLTLNWEEVRTLRARCGQLELGVHTREHPDLSTHPDLARVELDGARADIERETGARPRVAAFPYNRATSNVVETAVRLGFQALMGGGTGDRVTEASSLSSLPRAAVPRSLTRFAYLTSGAPRWTFRGLFRNR